MATASSGCRTTTLFPHSVPKQPAIKLSLVSQQLLFSNKCRPAAFLGTTNTQISSLDSTIPCSVSSPDSTLTEEEAEERGNVAASPSDDEIPLIFDSPRPLTYVTCLFLTSQFDLFFEVVSLAEERILKGVVMVKEGRIQGGIAMFPGFGWWPIKAYRPCPAYLASGVRYRRTGQSDHEKKAGTDLNQGKTLRHF